MSSQAPPLPPTRTRSSPSNSRRSVMQGSPSGAPRSFRTHQSLVPISKHYDLNNTILNAFRTLYEAKSYSVAYNVGVHFVETTLLDIPRHGYYLSERHEEERKRSVQDAVDVTDLLRDIVAMEDAPLAKAASQEDIPYDELKRLHQAQTRERKVEDLSRLARESAVREQSAILSSASIPKPPPAINENWDDSWDFVDVVSVSSGAFCERVARLGDSLCPAGQTSSIAVPSTAALQDTRRQTLAAQPQPKLPSKDAIDTDDEIDDLSPAFWRVHSSPPEISSLLPNKTKPSNKTSSDSPQMLPPTNNNNTAIVESNRSDTNHTAIARPNSIISVEDPPRIEPQRSHEQISHPQIRRTDSSQSRDRIPLHADPPQISASSTAETNSDEDRRQYELDLERALYLSGLDVRQQPPTRVPSPSPSPPLPTPRASPRLWRGSGPEAAPRPPDSLDIASLSSCYREDFVSLVNARRVLVSRLKTHQGRLSASVNGCTVIAPLLAVHHLHNAVQRTTTPTLSKQRTTSTTMDPSTSSREVQGTDDDDWMEVDEVFSGNNDNNNERSSRNYTNNGDDPAIIHTDYDQGLPDDVVEDVIDAESASMLPDVRRRLGLAPNALIIPSDVHDYLLERGILSQDQFAAVCGGNILDLNHLNNFITALVSAGENAQKTNGNTNDGARKLGKAAAVLFFREHVICVQRLVRRKTRVWKVVRTIPPVVDSKARVTTPSSKRGKKAGQVDSSLPKPKKRWPLKVSGRKFLRRNSNANPSPTRNDNDVQRVQDEEPEPTTVTEMVEEHDDEIWFDIIDSLSCQKLLDGIIGDRTSPSFQPITRDPQLQYSDDEYSSRHRGADETRDAADISTDFDYSHQNGNDDDALMNLSDPKEEFQEHSNNSGVRIRCMDVESLTSVLLWYACAKFGPMDCKYVDSYAWEDRNSDFDPRVFQGFVWAISE